MGIKNRIINNSNQLTNLGTIISAVIYLALAGGMAYFIYWLIKKTKNESLSHKNRLKEDFEANNYLTDSSGYFDDGYYNFTINNKLVGLTQGTNPKIEIISNVNSSDNINRIFFITKFNQQTEDKLYYIIPLKRAGKFVADSNFSINSTSYSPFNDNKQDEAFQIELLSSNTEYKIKKGDKYFTIGQGSTNITLEDGVDSVKQKVKFEPKNALHYYYYENGIYNITTEDGESFLCRIERVLGKTNTYIILKHTSNSEQSNKINLEKDTFTGFRTNVPLNKSNTNNQYFIQPADLNDNTNINSFIVKRNDAGTPYSRKAIINKYNQRSGLTNGYYFISYKIGSTEYLLSYNNNSLSLLQYDNVANKMSEIINNSAGNDIFLIKNTSENYHTIQIANDNLELKLNNDGTGNYELFFEKINDINNDLKIYKEENNSYTFNFDIPNKEDDNSKVKSKTLYLQINKNKLIAPNSNENITSDDTTTRFYIHYIAPEINTTPTSQNECDFYSRFLKRKTLENEVIINSINDPNNYYKESEFRNLEEILNTCNNNNIRTEKYNYKPDYIFTDSQEKDSYKKNLYENDYETEGYVSIIDDMTISKKLDNSTVYNCKNECDTDGSCKKFVFEEKQGSESYLGNCRIIYNNDITNLKEYEPESNHLKYKSYHKNVKVMSAVPTEEQKIEILPSVINTPDDSCSIRGPNTCEDKNYCILKGNNCLRKCEINSFNGTSKPLDIMDVDSRCIGSLHDFDITFQEINRDFDLNSTTNSITIKLKEIKLINITKNLHHPVLKYNNGFTIQFKCIGNNSLDTDFEIPIDYKLVNDDYKVGLSDSKLILGDKVDEVNIQVPQEIVECSAKGYTLILKVKLTDIYDQSKIIDVIPLDKNNKIVYDVNNKINTQEYFNKISLGRSIHNVINSKINSFFKT